MATFATGRKRTQQVTNKEVGERLTLIERAFDKSGVQMADLLGVDEKLWSKYKTGRVGLPWQLARKIHDELGASMDWVYGGTDRGANKAFFNHALDTLQAQTKNETDPPPKRGRPRKVVG